jgi:hypothetical protein
MMMISRVPSPMYMSCVVPPHAIDDARWHSTNRCGSVVGDGAVGRVQRETGVVPGLQAARQ